MWMPWALNRSCQKRIISLDRSRMAGRSASGKWDSLVCITMEVAPHSWYTRQARSKVSIISCSSGLPGLLQISWKGAWMVVGIP